MKDIARALPGFGHAAHIGDEGMILAAEIDHLGRPESVARAVRLELQPACYPTIVPRRAPVRRRGDPDIGAMDPFYTFLVIGVRPPVGVEHPPGLLGAV